MRKLNVILDLDQTLISAEDYGKKKNFNKEKMSKFYYKEMDKDYVVFARPHLQTFLDYLFDNFNVACWTAASKTYALFIVKNFILTKENRKLDFLFFSYHCDYSSQYGNGIKDLSLIWTHFGLTNYNEHNSIIIDDNSEVKNVQLCNCFHIKPFEFTDKNSENDKELLLLINKLEKGKQVLSSGANVCLSNELTKS